jgi:uncharacterized membrane protein
VAAANKTATFLGSLTLIVSIAAFVTGSGPFSQALVMAALAIPLAVVVFLLGASRLALATLYWAVTAFLPITLNRSMHLSVDHLLLLLGVVGILATSGLYFHYLQCGRSRDAGIG